MLHQLKTYLLLLWLKKQGCHEFFLADAEPFIFQGNPANFVIFGTYDECADHTIVNIVLSHDAIVLHVP